MSQSRDDTTQAVVTRAEIEWLVTDYFEQLRGILEVWFYAGCTQSPRYELYMRRRIDDFIKAGAISKDKVMELRDKFLGEFDSLDPVECERIQREFHEGATHNPNPQSDALDKGATE